MELTKSTIEQTTFEIDTTQPVFPVSIVGEVVTDTQKFNTRSVKTKHIEEVLQRHFREIDEPLARAAGAVLYSIGVKRAKQGESLAFRTTHHLIVNDRDLFFRNRNELGRSMNFTFSRPGDEVKFRQELLWGGYDVSPLSSNWINACLAQRQLWDFAGLYEPEFGDDLDTWRFFAIGSDSPVLDQTRQVAVG